MIIDIRFARQGIFAFLGLAALLPLAAFADSDAHIDYDVASGEVKVTPGSVNSTINGFNVNGWDKAPGYQKGDLFLGTKAAGVSTNPIAFLAQSPDRRYYYSTGSDTQTIRNMNVEVKMTVPTAQAAIKGADSCKALTSDYRSGSWKGGSVNMGPHVAFEVGVDVSFICELAGLYHIKYLAACGTYSQKVNLSSTVTCLAPRVVSLHGLHGLPKPRPTATVLPSGLNTGTVPGTGTGGGASNGGGSTGGLHQSNGKPHGERVQ